MKGMFKSKPKKPVKLVKLTREFLIYVNRNTEMHEKKREEKVCAGISAYKEVLQLPTKS